MSNLAPVNHRYKANVASPYQEKAKEQARIYLTHVSRRETRVSRFR